MHKLSAIVLSIFLLPIMAQTDHHVGGKQGGKYKNRLISKLELTEEQRQPVAEILQEQRQKRKEIMQPAFEEVKPQMQALHEETRQRLAGVLTEEQLQKFDDLSSKRKARMEKRAKTRD